MARSPGPRSSRGTALCECAATRTVGGRRLAGAARSALPHSASQPARSNPSSGAWPLLCPAAWDAGPSPGARPDLTGITVPTSQARRLAGVGSGF